MVEAKTMPVRTFPFGEVQEEKMAQTPGPRRVVQQMGALMPADGKVTLLHVSTRYDYFSRFVPLWKRYHVERSGMIGLALAGVILLFYVPVLAFVAFIGAGYFYEWNKLSKQILYKSERVVILPK